MTRTISSRVAGISLAVALAAGAAAPLPLALAADAGTDFSNAVTVSNTDVQQLIANVASQGANPVALNLHKYIGDPVATQPEYTGGQANNAANGLTPANGVQFTVRRVNNIDLTTVAGWQQYSELRNATTPDAANLGPATTLTTANGVATGNFPVGVYYVEETVTPAGATAVAPFYIALPLPLTSGTGTDQVVTGWNRDVHVYPKNQQVTGEKTVDDSRVYAGENIKYTVSGSVPAVPATNTFDGYDIVDDFDETRLDVVDSTIAVKLTGGTTPTSDTTLDSGTDYQVVKGNGKFGVSLTEDGLKKLVAARQANKEQTRVVLSYEAKLKDGATPGEATNSAQIYPPNTANTNAQFTRDVINVDNPNRNVKPIDVSAVKTVLGQITINKVGENDAALKGAKFQLYRCNPGTTETNAGPITVNRTNTWTTGDDGSVILPAIQVEDFYNNASQDDSFDYCVVETQAPRGYALNPQPVAASITNANRTNAVKITNVKDNTAINLPTTGERGTLFAVIGGGLLALLAALYFARRNRAA